MDLSTAADIHPTREWIIRNIRVPIVPVPIYQGPEKVDGDGRRAHVWDVFPDKNNPFSLLSTRSSTPFPIHAFFLLLSFPLPAARGPASCREAGRIKCRLLPWPPIGRASASTSNVFEELCEILLRLRRRLSRGDGPAARLPTIGPDANDEAQLGPTAHLGELYPYLLGVGLQVMIEGPAPTVPLSAANKSKETVDLQKEVAPKAVLPNARGPAHHRHRPPLRHITSGHWRGGPSDARTAMLCYVTPKGASRSPRSRRRAIAESRERSKPRVFPARKIGHNRRQLSSGTG